MELKLNQGEGTTPVVVSTHVPECHIQAVQDNMTSFRFVEFLLFLLFHLVYTEGAEPVFKAESGNIELGYCFGVDYIAVYRCAPEGDQLLGNSSDDSVPITPPADLQGRIIPSNLNDLLGLQIRHLNQEDSGIYRRECWKNQTLASQRTLQLFVCDEEVESKEVIVTKEDEGTELRCDSTSLGLEGTSVRWYLEMDPSYSPRLLIDSNVSLELLEDELRGVVEARDGGATLFLHNSWMKNNSDQFYCLVIEGTDCLSFQNVYLPLPRERSDTSLLQNSLSTCPGKQPKEVVSEDGNITLECDVGQDDSHSMQWYRQGTGEEYELIHDSNDKSLPIPEDLLGRMTPSENGSTLTLSHHEEMENRGIYLCVVLQDSSFIDDDDYEDDYEDGDTYDEYEDYYFDTRSCLFKQENILRSTSDVRGKTSKEPPRNITAYALGAGLTGLVVVGVVVAVIVGRRRARPKQTDVALRSGLNTNMKINEDPGCTERLTPHDDFSA